MEKQPVTVQLSATRARIRALLIADPETGRIEADEFPRSAVMRFVFNPRARRAAMTALSMGAMLAGRRAAAATGVWPMVSRSFSQLMERVRH